MSFLFTHPQGGAAPQLPACKQNPEPLASDPLLVSHHLLQLGHSGLLPQLHGHGRTLVVPHKHCVDNK